MRFLKYYKQLQKKVPHPYNQPLMDNLDRVFLCMVVEFVVRANRDLVVEILDEILGGEEFQGKHGEVADVLRGMVTDLSFYDPS